MTYVSFHKKRERYLEMYRLFVLVLAVFALCESARPWAEQYNPVQHRRRLIGINAEMRQLHRNVSATLDMSVFKVQLEAARRIHAEMTTWQHAMERSFEREVQKLEIQRIIAAEIMTLVYTVKQEELATWRRLGPFTCSAIDLPQRL